MSLLKPRPCKSCGASIILVRSDKGGSYMPLDATPERRVVIVNGEMPDIVADPNDTNVAARVIPVYTSHWATCPSADQHRKKR